ncbi:anti-sigma factor family protein [Amycolatopsis thermoflava]|uniref:anti-sigma factor family protein n=1 Tax=Amycolatopsis thermoflava TaxID=84480 RepID=UPI00365AF86F
MTDESRGIEAAGPPWSVDLLADLHAGVLDDDEAARLWPLVQADPEARAIIDALEATTADLADLSADVPPMPAEFAARLDAAIAEESRRAFPQQQPGVAPVVSLDAARRRRNKRIGWISGVVAVAAAAVAAVAIAIPGGTSPSSGGSVAAPPPGQSAQQPPLNLRSDQTASAVGQMQGTFDYGPLGGADALQRCLTAAGFADTAKPIGVRQGSIDGQPAVLTLLTTGQLAKFRLVAFTPTCGSDNAGVLLDKVIG